MNYITPSDQHDANHADSPYATLVVPEVQILFDRPAGLIDVSSTERAITRFEADVELLCNHRSFIYLMIACQQSRDAFEKCMMANLDPCCHELSTLAVRFIRAGHHAIVAASDVIAAEDPKSLRGMRSTAYMASIQRRHDTLNRLFIYEEDIEHVLDLANSDSDSDVVGRGQRSEPTVQLHDIWVNFIVWRMRTGAHVLYSEMLCEHGPWALSATVHAPFAENLLSLAHWMLDCGRDRCGFSQDDQINVRLKPMLLELSERVIVPLSDVACRYRERSADGILDDLNRNADRGAADRDLEGEAEKLITNIREERLPRILKLLDGIHSGADWHVNRDPGASFTSPIFYATVYELYRKSAPAEDRARDASEDCDLRFNAMRDWLDSKRPGLAEFIVSELRSLAIDGSIGKSSTWRSALVLVGEHVGFSKLVATSDHESLNNSLRLIIESLVADADAPTSQLRILKSAIRTLIKEFDPIDEQILSRCVGVAVSWDVRYCVLKSIVEKLKNSTEDQKRISDSFAQVVVELVGKTLDPFVFDGGDIACTAIAGIELLILTERPEVEAIIQQAFQVKEKWFELRLKKLLHS